MLDHNLELLSPQGQHLGTELAHAIDAIGSEISRQIGEVVVSRKVRGDELFAVRDRLGAKNRAGMPIRLRDALPEKHKLQEACKAELPVSLRNDPRVQAILSSAAIWHVEALKLHDFARAGVIDVDTVKEAELVKNLEKAAADMVGKLAGVAKWDPPQDPTDFLNLNPSRYDQLRATMSALADAMNHETLRLAEGIVNPTTKKAMKGSKAVLDLTQAIGKLHQKDAARETESSFYREVKDDFTNLRHSMVVQLGAKWRPWYKYLDGKLNDTTAQGYDKAVAKEFDKRFGGSGLAELLDGWAGANRMRPTNARGNCLRS